MPSDLTGLVTAARGSRMRLDKNPLLAALTDPQIDRTTYSGCLLVFKSFFHAVEAERQRHQCWPLLSLDDECRALECDAPQIRPNPLALTFATSQNLLGGLYVAHGIAFARAGLRRNVITALPDGSHQFIGRQHNKVTWRLLTNQMQFETSTPTGKTAVRAGATYSFAHVARLTAATVSQAKSVST